MTRDVSCSSRSQMTSAKKLLQADRAALLKTVVGSILVKVTRRQVLAKAPAGWKQCPVGKAVPIPERANSNCGGC